MKKVLAVFMSVLMFTSVGSMVSASRPNHKGKHKKQGAGYSTRQSKSSPKKGTKPTQSNNTTDEFPVAPMYNPNMIRSKTVVEDKNDKESPDMRNRNSRLRKESSVYSRLTLSPAGNTEEALSPREVPENLDSRSDEFALISSKGQSDSSFYESGLYKSVIRNPMGSQNQSSK